MCLYTRSTRPGCSGTTTSAPSICCAGLTRDPEAVGSKILCSLGHEPEDVRSAALGAISGPSGSGWTGHAPGPRRRWPRRRVRGLAIAREEALEEGNHDLARKLLELDIEDREKRDEPKSDDV